MPRAIDFHVHLPIAEFMDVQGIPRGPVIWRRCARQASYSSNGNYVSRENRANGSCLGPAFSRPSTD